jgi:hypothetical protein
VSQFVGGAPQQATATVADRLRLARGRSFVGRNAELELVRGALESPEPSFAVLFLHGPGGVGKSALLRAIEDLATSAGATATRLDLRAVEPSPPAFAAALGEGRGSRLLLLDTYEVAGALDVWLREEFIPALPAGALVVIAGRDPPAPAWLTDPGWRELLRVVSLRNLPPGDARALLRVNGVDRGLHDRLVETTHGHPLALSLLVDVLAQRPGAAPDLGGAPDVVRTLLERFLVDVPGARHRQALEVCAHARTTTEGLLRDALDVADASQLLWWLRSLSFIDEGERGVFPHDLVRDVLSADMRWRDPDGYAEMHRRIHDHVVARLDEGQDHVGDLVFLHRDNPFTARFWDWSVFGEAYADEFRDPDRAPLLAMAERHEGAASAALVGFWLQRQPQGFVVFRGAGARPLGFVAMLALHEASPEDVAHDPGTAAMWAAAQRHAPPRPGEEIHAARFFMDAEAYQAPASPSMNVLTIASTQRWIARRRPAWELIGGWADPDAAAPLMAYIRFARMPSADYEVGGRRYGVFGHDWRRMDPQRWLQAMAEREVAPGFEPEPVADPPALALSQAEFAQAVRQGLRDLCRPAALAANPLVRTRVVQDRCGGEPAGEALEAVLRETVASLRADPRDEHLERVLDRTYVRPAATQELAAELLGLPSSTYRRHLARGVERVAGALWQRELDASWL